MRESKDLIRMLKEIKLDKFEKKPKIREDYLQKLEAIKKGRFIKVRSMKDFKKKRN